MDERDRNAIARMKSLLLSKVPLRDIVLFGSRARGDAVSESDMDVLVILDAPVTRQNWDIVLDCAWEAGFEADIVIAPVVVSHQDWQNGPEHDSLLAKIVREEGVVM